MKRLTFILCILSCFLLWGCDSDKNGIELPFTLEDIQQIELVYHTGDASNSQRKWVTDAEDIHYIHNMFSSEILVEPYNHNLSGLDNALRIRFCLIDGSGYSIKYDGFGVKKGILSSSDFTYFTSADVAWLWDQLASEYEAEPISIVEDIKATETPAAEE